MTKLRLMFFNLLFISIFLSSYAYAAFNEIGIGARPLGLGGAFVALADDSNATNYNAAGLSYITDIHISATHAQRFNGLVSHNTIIGIIPLGGFGTLGANFGSLTEDSDIYKEQTIRLSYARTIIKQFGLGINLKRLGTSFDKANEFVAENPYFTNTSSSAFSLDLGLLAKPFNSLSIGVSAENIVPVDVSISETHTDTVPMNIRAGIAYSLESIAEMSAQGAAISNLLRGTIITFEVTSRDGDISTSTGVEMWVNNTIGIRGGFGRNNSGNSATTFSLGGSAILPISGTAFQLDYGFQLLTGDFQDNTTQRFSINLLF